MTAATEREWTSRLCSWWPPRPHAWSIVKTAPELISAGLGFTSFAWERCGRCQAGRIHEFPGQWLDQYPRWED